MALLDKGTVKGVAILLGIGLLAGFVGNIVAGPSRKMEWGHEYPVRGKPNCPETLPPSGASAPADVTAPAEATTPAITPEATAPLASSAPAEATTATAATAAPATSAPAPATSAPATSAGADVPAVPPDKDWLEVTPAQVDALFAKGAVFLDARLTSQYQEGHVQGAHSVPVWEAGLDEKVDQLPFLAEGDFGRPIVGYCNGGDCEDSHNLATKAHEKGFTAVYVYKDGFPDWLKRGRPVSTGDAP